MSRHVKMSDEEKRRITLEAIAQITLNGEIDTEITPAQIYHTAKRKYPAFQRWDAYDENVKSEIEKYNEGIAEILRQKKYVSDAMIVFKSASNTFAAYMDKAGNDYAKAWKIRETDMEGAFLVLRSEITRQKKEIEILETQQKKENESELLEIITELRAENATLKQNVKVKEEQIKNYEIEKEELCRIAANQVRNLNNMYNVNYINNPIAKGMTYQCKEENILTFRGSITDEQT